MTVHAIPLAGCDGCYRLVPADWLAARDSMLALCPDCATIHDVDAALDALRATGPSIAARVAAVLSMARSGGAMPD